MVKQRAMTLHLSADDLVTRQREKQRVWRQANPDKCKEYGVRHNARPEVKARKRVWQLDNKDEINRRKREKYALDRAELKSNLPEPLE